MPGSRFSTSRLPTKSVIISAESKFSSTGIVNFPAQKFNVMTPVSLPYSVGIVSAQDPWQFLLQELVRIPVGMLLALSVAFAKNFWWI